MWRFSQGNRKSVLLYTFLSIIANSVLIIAPLIIGNVLNIIQTNGITSENITVIILSLAVFIIVEACFWIFHWPSRVIERKNAFVVRANFKEYLTKNLMYLPLQWHNENHSGDIHDRIEKSSNALFVFSGETFTIIGPITSLIASILMLAYFHLPSLLIIIPMCIIAIIISLKFDSTLIKQYSFLNNSENTISEKMIDSLSNITTVIILRVESMLRKSIMGAIMHPQQVYNKNVSLNETKWATISIIGSSMIFFVIVSYILLGFASGVIMIGTIYILYEYSQKIRTVFYQFTLRYGTITQQMTAMKNIDPVINAFEKKKKVKRINLDKWDSLTVSNMRFSYLSGKKVHPLKNISFEIKKGERIAFVGASGSGKSTMLKLMRSLYLPRAGTVFIDGIKLKNAFKGLSYKISLIPQDPEIFKNTVLYNITLGIRYRKEHVDKVANMACFLDVIKKLPNGYNTIVGEKGAKLSGGEKQRLALARGILASEDKEIILLDEPTSSVDIKNERNIYQNIMREFGDKTIISTIHKLTLLKMFDKIVFFENGKITQTGTLQELLQNKNFYSLWKKNAL